MAPKARFSDGEKVLCFHGPLLYEAKCLKSQIKDKHMKYFIHYSGWNKNWDEWVPECRVLKYNEANLQKQKELAKTHMKAKKSKAAKIVIKKEPEKEAVQPALPEKPPKVKSEKKIVASPTPAETHSEVQTETVKKKKPRPEPCFVDEVKVEREIKITISPFLKNWLVDDWDLITRQKKILQLPARITVDHIIASYVKEKVSDKTLSATKEAVIVTVTNQIRNCFNVLLGKMLLYKFERPQYAEMLAEYPESSMCQIYGAIHLLRMLSKLGGMLTSITTVKGMHSLVEHLEDFTRYISVNPNFFSLNDYVVASPEYHRRAL
ncbi:Mortality factor 4-like protein 1, partial [Stegodyphus mimosarum]